MNDNTDRLADLALRAVQTFGRPPQTVKAIEEMTELIHALCRDMISQPDASEDVCEEIVDTWIMLAQLTAMYDGEKLDKWMERKLDRLEAMLPDPEHITTDEGSDAMA